MRRSLLLWAALALLYGLFRLWYDGGGGPLSTGEIAHYVARLEARGEDPARVDEIRRFLENDTGSDFVMANLILFQDRPDAREELDRYMEHMYPALFARACHPVLAGAVVGPALDHWGLDGAERWSLVGLVRYRSRRDMIEIASDPAFRDAHVHKQAAMARTIAIPSEPFLLIGSPRWLVGGVLILAGALLQLALRARPRP